MTGLRISRNLQDALRLPEVHRPAAERAFSLLVIVRHGILCRLVSELSIGSAALTRRGALPIVIGTSMSQDCFADEIAIDFPSVEPAVERMRDAFLGERPADDDRPRAAPRGDWCRAAKRGTGWWCRSRCRFAPCAGTAAVAARSGREPCTDCHGTGTRLYHHSVRVTRAAGHRRRRAHSLPRLLSRRRSGPRRGSYRDHQSRSLNRVISGSGSTRADPASQCVAGSTKSTASASASSLGVLTTLVGRRRCSRDRRLVRWLGDAESRGNQQPRASTAAAEHRPGADAIRWGARHQRRAPLSPATADTGRAWRACHWISGSGASRRTAARSAEQLTDRTARS